MGVTNSKYNDEDNQEPRKKKARGDDDDDPALVQHHTLTPDDLIDVLPKIVDFLDPSSHQHSSKDWSAVALTGVALNRAVQACANQRLAYILANCAVDETFQDRVRDQALAVIQKAIQNKNPTAAAAATFKTEPTKRLLYKIAIGTHLYKLVAAVPERNTLEGLYRVVCTALNPTKQRLLVVDKIAGSRLVCVRIWDLAAKQSIHTFSFQLDRVLERERMYTGAHYFDDRIVVCTSEAIQVFTPTGELLHEYHHRYSYIRDSKAHGHNILFSTNVRTGNNYIGVFDIHSGSVQQGMGFDRRFRQMSIVGVCYDKWLLVEAGCEVHNGETNGVYVFDLANNFSQNHFLGFQDSRTVTQSSDCPTIFYALPKYNIAGSVDVLELSRDGRLSRKLSFGSPELSRVVTGVHSGHHDRLFVSVGSRHARDDTALLLFRHDHIRVYDARNGAVEGFLTLPPGLASTECYAQIAKRSATNEKELFLALLGDSQENQRQVVVAAYLKDGYYFVES